MVKIEGNRSKYQLRSSTVINSYQQSQSPDKLRDTERVKAPDFATRQFLCDLAGTTFSDFQNIPVLKGLTSKPCQEKSVNPGLCLKIKFGFLSDVVSHQTDAALGNNRLRTVLTQISLVPTWKIQKRKKKENGALFAVLSLGGEHYRITNNTRLWQLRAYMKQFGASPLKITVVMHDRQQCILA